MQLCCIINALFIHISLSTRYYVDPSATGSALGTSWIDAFNTLDSALTIAMKQTDKIWLRGGFTYKPSNPKDRSDCFITNNGLSIYGGFDGTETTLTQRSTNNPSSVLSGDIGIVDDISDNCYHVIQYTQTLTLDNIIIQNGNANYEGEYSDDLVRTMHALHRYAGAIITTDVVRSTSLYLNDVKIRNNTAINGGALWFAASPMTDVQVLIKNSQFEHNKAVDGIYEGGYGGAIYEMFLANITLIDTTFVGNEATNRGGAIYQDYGALLYANGCTFEYNKVNGFGGAIFSEDRNSQTDGTFPQIISSILRFNEAGINGGAIFWYNGVIGTLQDNTFRDNTAQYNGGAIALINSEYASNGNTFINNDVYNETLIEYDDIDDTLTFNLSAQLTDLYAVWNTMQTEADTHPFDAADSLCYVDGENTNSIKDGTSWNKAYTDIQTCLDALESNGGEIWVKAGTYSPTTIPEWKQNLGRTQNIHKTFSMYDNIRMFGGFYGTETTRYQRNWRDHPTYLSCQITNTLQCNQLITAADDAVIDGFIFENAGRGVMNRRRLANSISVEAVLHSKPFSSGSGILSNSTTITVVNSIFHKLFSSGKGAALYCIGMQGFSGITKAPTFINVAFLGNRAAVRGGAISADAECDFECISCIFDTNSCSLKGGAIYLDFDCDPIFTDSTFINNNAVESGGCIAADGVSLVTFNGINTFTSNSAQMEGGCLYSGSGVGINTLQGFEFTETAPIFTNNFMVNDNNIGHNDIYGWPYSIMDVIPDITNNPTNDPSSSPTKYPTDSPINNPTDSPTKNPTDSPSNDPSTAPSSNPSFSPSISPTSKPSQSPVRFGDPTHAPSSSTNGPTTDPSTHPSAPPTLNPSINPSNNPSIAPTYIPTVSPSNNPTHSPSNQPSSAPSINPISAPSQSPVSPGDPTHAPTNRPSSAPTNPPSNNPTNNPTTGSPTMATNEPSNSPVNMPTAAPSLSASSHSICIKPIVLYYILFLLYIVYF